MAMAASVMFYSSSQSTGCSSCPSSATAATPVARAGCGNSSVPVYAAPSRALLREHTRVAVEVLQGDAAATVADGDSPKAAAEPLDLGILVWWDRKAVFSELIKISSLIQEASLQTKSMCVQVQQLSDLDTTSFGLRLISVYDALQSVTKISGIDIAPHPDNLFVVLCMLKSLTELFSLWKQKFLPFMEEHIADDLSTRFDPTLLALSRTVRRTLEILEVWIMQGHGAEDVPHGGSIHEITRYIMVYIKLLLEHGDSLAVALNAGRRDAGEAFPGTIARVRSMHTMNGIVGVLIHHLRTTLEKVSSRYRAAALQWLFLGNNMHFVVQHKEVLETLGDDWVLKHRDKLGECISRYLEVSWAPVLSCLRAKSAMDMIPVCFRQPALSRFTLKFEEACSTQKLWKVEDPLLRKHMRRAVVRKVIPAYRSYVEKRQEKALKLMKYKPEDLKEQLSDLFEG